MSIRPLTPEPAQWTDDLELVRRALEGRADALDELLLHMDRIPAFVRRIHGRLGGRLGSHELDDTAQEVVLQVWRKLGSFEGNARLDSWIYGFARNEVLKSLKRQRRERLVPNDTESELVDPHVEPESPVDGELVQVAIASLDSESLALLQMKYLEGWSFRRMAEATGEPLGTIRNRFYRTVELVRQRVGSRGRIPE